MFLMIKVLPFLFMVFTLVFQISIPSSVIEFNKLSPDTVTDLSDFNDSNEDPSDDTSDDNNFEVIEVLYSLVNRGPIVSFLPIFHVGDLHTFISSYVDKRFIPPSL